MFKLAPSGSNYNEYILYSFCKTSKCGDGKWPSAGLIFDTNGALYGTSSSGGAHGSGAIFKLTPSGSGYVESVLYSFCSESRCRDGANPAAELVIDNKGALYGTTTSGGDKMRGVVFSLIHAGSSYTERVLYRFCQAAECTDGAEPHAAVTFGQHGELYGTTTHGGIACYFQHSDGCGVVFRLVPSGTGYKERVLHAFCIRCTRVLTVRFRKAA